MSNLPAILDTLDDSALSVALSSVPIKVRNIVQQEIAKNPEKYVEVLKPEKIRSNPVLDAMDDIVDHVENNKDIRDKYKEIDRLTKFQDIRAEVFQSLYQSYDYGRFVKFLKARDSIEKVLLTVINNAEELDPISRMVLLDYLNNELRFMEKRVAANSVSGKDIAALLAKMDQTLDLDQEEIRKQLKGSTAQNRELIRRVGHKLLKTVKEQN